MTNRAFAFILRCFRWVIRFWLKTTLYVLLTYPMLLVLMYYTTSKTLLNGAELHRNIDWKNWSRADLYLPNWDLIAQKVDRLCWNETAISGVERPIVGRSGAFVWLGGDSLVIFEDNPLYAKTLLASGLDGPKGDCGGFYPVPMGAEMLLGNKCPILPPRDIKISWCHGFRG